MTNLRPNAPDHWGNCPYAGRRPSRGLEIADFDTIMRLLRPGVWNHSMFQPIESDSPKKPHPENDIDSHDQIDP